MQAKTIDEVITALQAIIDDSKKNNSRLGYFAVLYYKVTASVRDGIRNGQFQNGPRMEQLDVIFANRYLEAYTQWQQGAEPSYSWKLAFEMTKKSSVLILQHLLLGMNAHINLDLGIAAVEVSGDKPLQELHNDFNMINTIISSLTYQVLSEIDRSSPLLSLLGLHAGNSNSVLIQFSIDNARDGAWCFAEELYAKTVAERPTEIKTRDQNVLAIGKSLVNQTGFLKFTVWLIHLFEWKNPLKVIELLQENQKKYFSVNDQMEVKAS
ncbi:hypothetical protein LX99_02527 [Mucilaginibacter oryzae]|uniref:Uncharacterized protein n=1 Tax=Mucilaginibacter oryzae TaxID=468058 RepID=A0A316HCE2_9SPHI|nr:DUF5995 family protein [Mucilaginibacter oryzae]PWK77650.1 hypothetical protein LX99_02527 [Mucilaginibacter oryzae]